MSYYVITDDDPDHLPWLHGTGSMMVESATVMETLCDEIRRVVTQPRARPKSPLPRLRQEVANILAQAETGTYGPSRDLVHHVILSLDPACMEHLGLDAPSAQLSKEEWQMVAPHLTPKRVAAMADARLSLIDIHLALGAKGLSEEAAQELCTQASGLVTAAHSLGELLVATEAGQVPAPFAAEFLRQTLRHHAPEVFRSAMIRARVSQDAVPFLAAYLAWDQAGPCPAACDPAAPTAVRLAFSNHGRMQLAGRLPGLVDFIADPRTALRAL